VTRRRSAFGAAVGATLGVALALAALAVLAVLVLLAVVSL